MDWVKLFGNAFIATIGFIESSRRKKLQEEYSEIQTRLNNAYAERYPDFSMAKIQKIEQELEVFSNSYFSEIKKMQEGDNEDPF